MNRLLDSLKSELQDIVERIDAGNSHMTDEQAEEMLDLLHEVMSEDISKEEAYAHYLKTSRATFDNLVAKGELPKGKHKRGFKEKFWNKYNILKYITNHK